MDELEKLDFPTKRVPWWVRQIDLVRDIGYWCPSCDARVPVRRSFCSTECAEQYSQDLGW